MGGGASGVWIVSAHKDNQMSPINRGGGARAKRQKRSGVQTTTRCLRASCFVLFFSRPHPSIAGRRHAQLSKSHPSPSTLPSPLTPPLPPPIAAVVVVARHSRVSAGSCERQRRGGPPSRECLHQAGRAGGVGREGEGRGGFGRGGGGHLSVPVPPVKAEIREIQELWVCSDVQKWRRSPETVQTAARSSDTVDQLRPVRLFNRTLRT